MKSATQVIKFGPLILIAGLLTACVSNSKKNTDINYKITPFWVSDTLSKKNDGFRKINRFSPLLHKDKIIIGNGLDGLTSYDVATKNSVWKLTIPYGTEASAALIQNRLFVGGENGIMYSIDADNGKIIWTFDTKSEIVAEPLLQNGILYFLNGSNVLFSLEASSGKQLWVYNRQETSTKMTIRGGSKPTFFNGIVYVGFSDGSLVSLNASTGTPQWEVLLNKNTRFKDIDSSPVIDGDQIFVNSYDDKLYSISKSTGTINWKSDFGGNSQPLISGDLLIYASSRGQLIAVSKKDGKLIWKNAKIEGISTDPILHKGLVVVGESQGSLKFFDLLTGTLKGAFTPGRGIMSKPTSDKEKNIYFISGEANIYGVRIEQDRLQSIPYLVQ